MLLSVLVPTHNRPTLLREALASIAQQTCSDWEVVVVDDGSVEPISPDLVRSIVGERFRLLRNEPARGIAGAKNRGLEAAGGEVMVHLDDDDLLDSRAVECILSAYRRRPDIDCLFINVTAFGQNAVYANESQAAALAKLLAVAGGVADHDLTLFDRKLVLALLRTAPWSFQRPAATRAAWRRIGCFPNDVSLPEPEWALYAALYCRTALLHDRVYRARLDGQGYASKPSNWMSHLESGIRTRERFTRYLAELVHDTEIEAIRKAARRAYAGALASKAYYCTREEIFPGLAFKAALRSFGVRPSIPAAKLIAKSALLCIAQ
jgi:glycosyltransferase involved in cell wall biosynthesis